MNASIERFLERPASHKIAVAAFVLAFMAYIFWQYFYKTMDEELMQIEESIQGLNTQLSTERRLAKNLAKYKEEVALLDAKLNEVLKELPDKREIPDLLTSISSLARESGLEVGLFRPVPEQLRDFYAEVPVTLSVEGSYQQVASFFDEVARLPRIVNISSIAMLDPKIKPESIRIKTDCTITTFRYLDEDERKTVQEETAKRRK